MSFKLILAYDGTHYLGWQKTRMGPSIQESLQNAIQRITGEAVVPEAASRTDRGVHAEGQVVQVTLTKELDPVRLLRGLNAVLPLDIRILKSVPVADFHPTLDAVEKEYHYYLCLTPVQDPVDRLYSWHFRYPLDIGKMQRAAKDLLGTHDFATFAGEKEKDPQCTISRIEFDEDLRIKIRGNRFLYKMVRNLVGTLVYIGCGKLPEECIPSLLHLRDRKQAGVTAPAHGLHLHEVFYEVK